MDQRFIPNPYKDYNGQQINIDTSKIRNLIQRFVNDIVQNTRKGPSRGDLYVGDAGIAFMFLRLCQTNELVNETSAQENATFYINRAKQNLRSESRSRDDKCAFLCGNAGIYAVSAAISHMNQQHDNVKNDLGHFEEGFSACKPIDFSKYGSDEFLVGRAGFLGGVYWLNDTLKPKPFTDHQIVELCESTIQSGRKYSKASRSPFPLAYQYHSTEYLGAAHGLSSILHMLLQSPWFSKEATHTIPVKRDYEADIRNTIDVFLSMQDGEGNFPCKLSDALHSNGRNKLVHWCHGAPGVIYLYIKAYIQFGDVKYLEACKKASDLIWRKGLLRKGPNICHGVAGNGYTFLVMYRLTKEPKYLYRAIQFAYFLERDEFARYIRKPDCPWSLYEGLAGTVCYLVDLIHNEHAAFPFMNVF